MASAELTEARERVAALVEEDEVLEQRATDYWFRVVAACADAKQQRGKWSALTSDLDRVEKCDAVRGERIAARVSIMGWYVGQRVWLDVTGLSPTGKKVGRRVAAVLEVAGETVYRTWKSGASPDDVGDWIFNVLGGESGQ